VVTPWDEVIVSEDTASTEVDLANLFHDMDDDQLVYEVIENSNPELAIGSIQDSHLRLQTFQNASGTAELVIEARDSAGNVVHDTLVLNVIAENDAPMIVAPTPVDLMLDVSPGSAGTTSIDVRATDGSGGQATHRIVVNVSRSNQPPSVSDPIREIRVEENADRRQLDLDSIFSDPDGDLLRYEITNSNASLVSPQLVDTALNLWFASRQSGNATVDVTATDPSGLQTQLELRIEVEEKHEDQGTDTTDGPSTSDPLDGTTSNDTLGPVQPTPRRPLSLRFFLAR
jgi:hypothetical protein